MKILTAQQIKQADEFTIKNEPISSIDLMERAATRCVEWLKNKYNTDKSFAIFCGVGNNGGDGLVIARLLAEKKYDVKVFVVEFSKNYSPDFIINLEKLKKTGIELVTLSEKEVHFKIALNSIVIDAIFGSGLNKPIDGFVAEIIHQMNTHEIVSIDIPSGLFCEDNQNNNLKNIVNANYTLTFEQPKLAMMFPQNNIFCGECIVLPIGLHPDFIKKVETPYFFTSKQDVKGLVLPRQKFSHKGIYGHALLMVGSYGKMGAAILSSKACLRSGVGLLTVHVPTVGLPILQTAVPEAMCSVDEETNYFTAIKNTETYQAIGIGPGIGLEKQTQSALKLLIQNTVLPMVIDADALNSLAENKTWLSFLPNNSILTPHPKEFERLVGKWSNDEDRLKLQLDFSTKNNVIVVLKGAYTSISTPLGKVHFNSSGNPGMATAGAGDVLTGIIASLLAQGYLPEDAAILGVYLHGVAGDLAKEQVGEVSMIASDIIDQLPNAYGWLRV
ncbi:MAG: NAD(P)H-hydrate dehydratase [Bacteroidetes bacterium]|nr:NAD(P)H-hydrate dehydratase [Bacteroidota bacterium]